MTSVHMSLRRPKWGPLYSALLFISPKINQSPFLLKRQWSAWKPQSRCTFLFLEVSSKPCYYAVYSFPLPKIYNLPFIITQNLISNLIIHFIKVTFWTVHFGMAIALIFVSNISKCNSKPKFCDHPVCFFLVSVNLTKIKEHSIT